MKADKVELGHFVPVQALFPESSVTYEAFSSTVRRLSRTDSLIWCARLGSMVANPDVPHREAQSAVLSHFAGPQESEHLERYIAEKQPPRPTLVFRGQLLELVRWLVLLSEDQPNDGHTFEDEDVRREFLKVLLMASEIWSSRVQDPYIQDGLEIEEARRMALGSLRASLVGTADALRLDVAIGRGTALYGKFLVQEEPSYADEFVAATGMSFEDYFVALSMLGIAREGPEAPSRQVLFLPEHYGEKASPLLERYLHLEAQTADELRAALWGEMMPEEISDFSDAPYHYSYRPLLARPLLQTSRGTYVPLDLGFFKERATQGPLFHLLGHVADKGRLNHAFGKALERYICEGLQRMFPTAQELAQRLDCNVKVDEGRGEIELFDACLNDGPDVVVFEFTSRFIRDDRVLGPDPEAASFADELDAKYGPKLLQLARAVRYVERSLDDEFAVCEHVFPVLCVFDARLSMPLIGRYLHRSFLGVLAPDVHIEDGYAHLGRLAVAPLTIATVEDFETLENSVRGFGLVELLRAYSVDEPARARALKNYVALNFRFNREMRENTRLRDYHHEVYQHLIEILPRLD